MFRVTQLAISTCAGTSKDEPFGFTPYTCTPKYLEKNGPKVRLSHVMNKEKYKSFTQIHSNLFKSVPGPSYKGEGADWEKKYGPRQGCFLKKARDTFTIDIMKAKKGLPAPSKYHSDRYGGNGMIKPKNLVNYKQ